MARPSKEPPQPSPLAPAIVRLAEARGLDGAWLARRFGLPLDVAAHDEAAISAAGLGQILEAVAEALGEPFLALRLPDELPFRRYGLAELAARASGTLREALGRMARYASLVHPQLECGLDEQAGEARFWQRTRGHPRGIGRHAHEYLLAAAFSHCRRERSQPLAALRVDFVHARPTELGHLYRFFGTRALAFGAAENALVLPAALLDEVTPGGDPRLLATVDALAEEALRARPSTADFSALVAARLRDLLPADANMDAVAAALRMSARTLQRRLEQEGTRFSEVLDGVREELARRWVADRALPLAEVGYRLGFADLATFSRAFKRWTGKPPGTWRQS